MKWKLYKICSWYNIVASLTFCCLFFFWFAEDNSPDDILALLSITGVLSLVIIKNWMGIRLNQNIKTKQIHRDRFGLIFYFLWLFNVICLVAYLFLMHDTLEDVSFSTFAYRTMDDIVLICATLLAVPTLAYTVCLDIPLERQARKHIDFSEDLFKE